MTFSGTRRSTNVRSRQTAFLIVFTEKAVLFLLETSGREIFETFLRVPDFPVAELQCG